MKRPNGRQFLYTTFVYIYYCQTDVCCFFGSFCDGARRTVVWCSE